LNDVGLEWIQYIKIAGDSENCPEIDAVSDVGCFGDYKRPFLAGDMTDDCRVDFEDLEVLSSFWLCEVAGPESPEAKADKYGDGFIDFYDYAMMAKDWGDCSFGCGQ